QTRRTPPPSPGWHRGLGRRSCGEVRPGKEDPLSSPFGGQNYARCPRRDPCSPRTGTGASTPSAPERQSGARYSLRIVNYNGLKERSEGLAGAMQSRLHGSRIDAQMLGRLLGVEFLDVPEEEDLPVGRRQFIDAGPDLSARFGPREPGE